MTRSVIIASGVRTAIGDFGGALAGVSPCELATEVARAAIARAGIEASEIAQSIFGHVIHTAPEEMYLSRVAAIRAGVPETAPALTLNRLCGSGFQAVISGAEQIALGLCDVVLAGGAESMSRAGHLLCQLRSGQKMGDVSAVDMMLGALTDPFGNGHMGVTAENVADRAGISRETQDSFAVESHRRAAAAIAAGRFRDQIVPLAVRAGRKDTVFDTDEHVRPDVTLACAAFGLAAGPFRVMNLIKPAILLQAMQSLSPLGPNYTPAAGLQAIAADAGRWTIEADPAVVPPDVARLLTERLTGAALAPALEALAEGVVQAPDLDRGAKAALRFERNPVVLRDTLPTAEVDRLVALATSPQKRGDDGARRLAT